MLAQAGTRKTIKPPSGFEDHLCRRDAAALLGFASEFKVRQLEKEGRLRPIRGAMGSAWYPRREVEALRATSARPSSPSAAGLRWPDDALIALLREKPRTVVDLVVDAGISIARAERVYRFWQAHEGATSVREAPGGRVGGAVGAPRATSLPPPPARATPLSPSPTPPARATALSLSPAPARATPLSPSAASAPAPAAAALAVPADEAAERRSGERLEHDALVRQLRDADPKIRAAAFDKLKSQRR